MIIRKYKLNDLVEVCKLTQRTYANFNKNEGSKEAVQRYINCYSTKQSNLHNVKINFQQTPIFFVGIENQKIIGMIRGNKNRIVNLFVDGSQHKKGIGKTLVEKFEKEAKNLGSNEIKIKASLYATPFYQKIGYIKTTGIRNFHNLKIQPMRKIL